MAKRKIVNPNKIFLTKEKRIFDEPQLEVSYRQLKQIYDKGTFGMKVVLFKMKGLSKKKVIDFNLWLLNCPKGIDYEVKH